MSDGLIAVVDQGSSSTKGAVFSPEGERLQLVSIPLERHVDGASVSHDPEAIAASVVQVLRALMDTHPVAAFGLACQRSTCLLWERDAARPLTAAVSWQDRSQADRVAALAPFAETIRRRTGLRLSPHYAAPKLSALLDELPHGHRLAASGELVGGTVDAFIVHRLTGRPATEPGTAGRTLLYNLENDAWDERLGEIFGLPPALLPDLRPSAGLWGEFEGLPLLAVAGDQQASLIGHGGWQLGATTAHFGTGAFVLASTGEAIVRHDALLSAVLASTPETRRFQIEGSINSAGSAIDWARSFTGVQLGDWTETAIEDGPPWFLPAFSGVGAPWWKSQARAVAAGLELSTTPDDLFGAVVAGVAHRVLDCVETIAEAGIETSVLRVSGKLTRLDGLTQLLADAGQLPVEVSAEEETGALGLARLVASQLGAGDDALLAPPKTSRRVEAHWGRETAAAVRAEWLDFVHRALEETTHLERR